jgi:hypothetical protein
MDWEQESAYRGPAYAQGASHGSTGLAPPRWKYEFERPGGEDYWHRESQPSPRFFAKNKHQHVWGSDRPISGNEMGNGDPSSTMPLDVLQRRKSFTQRPIAIVSGSHGAWHGNDWDSTGARDAHLHEQAFLSEDAETRLGSLFTPNPAGAFEGYSGGAKVKGDLTGYVLKRDAKSGDEYYVSASAKKGSFESRLRIYDGAKMREPDFRRLVGDVNNHVVLGYCFSRNDEGLRYKGGATPLAPVTSYLSSQRLPLRRPFNAHEGTIVKDGGTTIAVPAGACIESVPGGRLRIHFAGGRVITTRATPELWCPPQYNPRDPQAPSKAVYDAHYP